jgi:hypothetical protein
MSQMPMSGSDVMPGPPMPPAGDMPQERQSQWAVRPVGGGAMSNNPGQWRFQPDATVPAGHIHVDINGGKMARFSARDHRFIAHEASTPQLQGLAQGLNQAAEHAAQTIHDHENVIRGRVVHSVSHMARWLNPGSKCNAAGAFDCYSKLQETQPWQSWDPTDTPANQCLVTNNCEDAYQQATPAVQQRIEQRAGANNARVA